MTTAAMVFAAIHSIRTTMGARATSPASPGSASATSMSASIKDNSNVSVQTAMRSARSSMAVESGGHRSSAQATKMPASLVAWRSVCANLIARARNVDLMVVGKEISVGLGAPGQRPATGVVSVYASQLPIALHQIRSSVQGVLGTRPVSTKADATTGVRPSTAPPTRSAITETVSTHAEMEYANPTRVRTAPAVARIVAVPGTTSASRTVRVSVSRTPVLLSENLAGR